VYEFADIRRWVSLVDYIVKRHDMNRVSLTERIEEARTVLEKLLTLLQSAPLERDQVVVHLYQARREYRQTCETAGSLASSSSDASSWAPRCAKAC
jgi:hypothetical protein